MNQDKAEKALKLALEALEKVTTEMLALKDELAERGARPTTDVYHQRLWDSAFKAYTDHALPAATAIKEALADKEQLDEILERPASRRELPAYMRSVPGVVSVARAE